MNLEGLNYNSKHTRYVNIDLDIINDLLDNKKLFKNGGHLAFAYNYLVIATWMYGYGEMAQAGIDGNSVQKILKGAMGLSEDNRTYNYIIREGGVLEGMNLLNTVSVLDTPYSREFNKENKTLSITILREVVSDDACRHLSKKKAKEPMRSILNRKYHGVEYLGTLQDLDFTIQFDMEKFKPCFEDKDFNYISWVHAFMKMKSDMYGGSYSQSQENIADELEVSVRTLSRVLKKMEVDYKLIEKVHKGNNYSKTSSKYKVL